KVVEVHIHRRAIARFGDTGHPDDILQQLFVSAREEPELSGAFRAVDIVEDLAKLDALRRDVMQKLAHLREDSIGIARTEIRLERDPNALHLFARRGAKSKAHAELRSDLDAEVREPLLLRLRDAAFVQRVSNALEDV